MMNEKLKQAISAARNGQETEAQLLLTQVLKEDPQEVQAWFLLSTLVESEQKKKVYLGKVLALDPNHPMASKMLVRLHEEDEPAKVIPVKETVLVEPAEDIEPIVDDSETVAEFVPEADLSDAELAFEEMLESDFDQLVEDEETAVTDDADFLAVESLAAEQEFESFESMLDVIEERDEDDAALTEWVEEGLVESETAPVVEAAVETTAKEDPVVVTKPAEKEKPAKKANALANQKRFLNWIYYALVIAAIVIFLLLLVQIWQIFF